jgi:hypothetical protein
MADGRHDSDQQRSATAYSKNRTTRIAFTASELAMFADRVTQKLTGAQKNVIMSIPCAYDDCSCLPNLPKPVCLQEWTFNRRKQVASASAFFSTSTLIA